MKLNGLDLFSGIGGLTLALHDWVLPSAYCENDRHAQSVLLSRMQLGELPIAPIWSDVQTLKGASLPPVEIIYGGFPCQDISIAGLGKGLAGERSGLYWQIERLVSEINPAYVFLENVPAIRTRGLNRVVQSLTDFGYDCRWTVVSAAEIGAPHLRKRWFLLGKSTGSCGRREIRDMEKANGRKSRQEIKHEKTAGQFANASDESAILAHAKGERCFKRDTNARRSESGNRSQEPKRGGPIGGDRWWETEPDVGRVVNGLPFRVDRIRGLGNAVVPLQAREAFVKLLGLQVK